MSIFFQTSSISGKKKPGKLTILSLQFALEKTHPGFAFCCDLRRHLCPLCAQRLPRCFEPTPPLAPNSWIWKMASLSSSSARMPLAGGLENCRSVLTPWYSGQQQRVQQLWLHIIVAAKSLSSSLHCSLEQWFSTFLPCARFGLNEA